MSDAHLTDVERFTCEDISGAVRPEAKLSSAQLSSLARQEGEGQRVR